MKRLSAIIFGLLLGFPALAANGPDTLVLTGPTFQQVPAGQIYVTPNGQTQTTLGAALAAGGALPSLSANQTLASLTSGIPTGTSLPSCSTASSALTWTSGTGFGCNTIASGGTPGGTSGQIQYNNSSAFGGISTVGTGNVVLATSPSITTPTLSGWPPSLGVLLSSTGAAGVPTNGGGGYSTGDILTIVGATCSAGNTPTLLALAQTGGVITRFQVANQGYCTIMPPPPVAVTGGTGSGATFPLLYGAYTPNVPIDNASGGLGNVYIGTGLPSAVNSITGVEYTCIGWHACAGQVFGAETTAVGYLAGGNADSAGSVYFGGAGAALEQVGSGGAVIATGISGGSVAGVTVQTPGTGYANGTFPLTIVGGGCVFATGTWTVSGGAIASAALGNAGTGCTSTPTVTLWPIYLAPVANNTALGLDSLRRASWATNVTAVGGAACQYCGWDVAIGFGGQANYITAVGEGAEAFNADAYSSANYGVGVGNNACHGGGSVLPTGYFTNTVCVGSKTGGSLTTGAHDNILLGTYTGNTTAATIVNTILIGVGDGVGSGNCDTPAGNTSNYFALCGAQGPWVTATATNAPTSTAATFTGCILIGAPTGGCEGTGTINVQGFFVQGTSVAAYSGTYGLSPTTTVAGGGGGSGYLVGDVLTMNDSCTPSATVVVTVAGAITSTGFSVLSPGICSSPPFNPVTTTGGTGTGATFTTVYGANGNIALSPNGINGNLFLAAPNAAFVGTGTILIGPSAGIWLAGNATTQSSSVEAIGVQTCGGQNSAIMYLQQSNCIGFRAGAKLTGASGNPSQNIDVMGYLALSNQATTTSLMTVMGELAAVNENYGSLGARIAVYGPNECEGASGSAAYFQATCVGSLDGGALTSAHNFILLGQSAGNTTFASGSDVILIATGSVSGVDTPAAGTTDYANFNGSWRITGMNSPATSVFTHSGLAIVSGTPTDLAQTTGGSTALAFFSTAGMSVGQVVSGTNIPAGDTVASIVATGQARFATTASSASGQTVISYTGASAAEAAGQQCVDVTNPTFIGAGNLIVTVTNGVSITLTSNIVTTIPSGDTIKCDPVVTLTTTTSTAVAAQTNIGFYTNHTTLGETASLVDLGDAAVYGNAVLGNLVFLTGIGLDTGQSDATLCDVTSTGKVYYGSGTGGICLTTSTARFKTRIEDQKEGLAQIMGLRPVGFNYLAGHGFDPDRRYNGFTAEEMESVLPQLVGHDEEGRPNSVDLMGLVPILVRTVQQQQGEIDDLRRRLH